MSVKVGEKYNLLTVIEVLPAGKILCKCDCGKTHIVGSAWHLASGNTKSADFQYGEYYATQKYTDGSGGAQDNQRNDVIDFLKRGSIKHKVAAIVSKSFSSII